MGWVWRDESETNGTSSSPGPVDIDGTETSGSGDQCSIRMIVKSQCKTEEIEPGKFIWKCQKTEQILKDCIGRPVEVIQSNTEYTEDDITNEMAEGALPFESSVIEAFNCPALRGDVEAFNFPEPHGDIEAFNCPGLRSEFEAFEQNVFGVLNHFFEAAEEMKNSFFKVFGTPDVYDRESSQSLRRRSPMGGPLEKEVLPRHRNEESANSDSAGQVRDV
ncbi:hypothetical protein NE237_009168 [Protea cynaroides]|uniref:Uncharacterized protein n=1 Tax=Protea cynaroides TaxID=273540 RepID=A0A9Q0R017_9MAGN|nr:hypothetical protein NE237_009168 [Protea cynaroides]